MSFTESNTVEQMILDAATSLGSGAGASVLREDPPAGWGGTLGTGIMQVSFAIMRVLDTLHGHY